MSLYIVDIHGDIEGDYEIVRKYEEQDPFINKPCVSSRVCEHDKQKVLDKIRAEIKALTSNRGFLSCSVDHIHEEIDAVFDKYKADKEQEDEKESLDRNS